MDDYKELNNWIVAHSRSLDLQVERLGWVNRWLPEFHDFLVMGKAFGRTFEGRGTDKNEEYAFYKAFSELIERIYCFGQKINSNGVAAHIDRVQATANAKKELVERDAILCHYLTKTPFRRLEGVSLPKKFEELSSRLKKYGITLTLGRALSAVENWHVAICHADGGEDFGILCGFGCDENLSCAFESAILECMINVVAHLDGNLDLPSLSVNELYKKETAKSLDHKRVHFAHKFFKLKTCEANFDAFAKIEGLEFEIQTLKGPLPLFDSIPIHVTRATSRKLQNVYYGKNKNEHFNFGRLSAFAGKELSLGMLPIVPHPIG
ncbi:MAG: hypothetical protein COV91_03530 [Candidatus Taylorbacteria bacterium CG11_big_fil_rev_8_21_14_0_20_46_11]|uniref:YcaO domain-containing protein n=1 Tax=Candidatus Taylorbacteria bacterium CG11_big_fil_rev_8_21_14_0_20_46_11 TaxID=1975025 RepID=A0A2H0KDB8_9BACT|nr:MAG: hypothetical protein COV91_03530 [Candidatus Taylorbacteria bacterium CG11_big_fil_rev_8_21_14_0_20_46_11]